MLAKMSWWHKCLILSIGGTNVMVSKMSCWQKCHGGTNVLFYNRWDKCLFLAIGGTNVMVAKMSYFIIGGTNVSS
jgi:hypothetical protein